MTVFLTTHYMEEAAEADYVVIIDDGKISAEGTPLELKNIYTGDYITIYDVDERILKHLMWNMSKSETVIAFLYRIQRLQLN